MFLEKRAAKTEFKAQKSTDVKSVLSILRLKIAEFV
jgi:hypothetical protein